MSEKIPLVLNSSGYVEQLQSSDTLAISAGNLLINGGFDFFQRQAPATPTSRSDDTYGPDRWVVLTQTAEIQVERTGGTESPYACKMTQNQATAQRMGLLQIIEYGNSMPMRSRSVIFQGKVNSSSEQAIRYAILEWTDTADAVTSDIVNDWTSSTYTNGNFFLSTTPNVIAIGSITPGAVGYTQFSITGTVGASCNNLVVFIWTEGTAAQNATLSLSSVGLYPGTLLQSWNPRPIGEEFALCQRYYEKSYDPDTAPGTVTLSGAQMSRILDSYWVYNYMTTYNVGKFSSGNPKIYAPNSGTTGYGTEYDTYMSAVADRAITLLSNSKKNFGLAGAGTLTAAYSILAWHWTKSSEL